MSYPYVQAGIDAETRFIAEEIDCTPMLLSEAVQRMSEIRVAEVLAGSGAY